KKGDHKHVRLSWVKSILDRSSGNRRPSSSVLLEIRSLLSVNSIRDSFRSSRSSRSSTASKVLIDDIPVYPVTAVGRSNLNEMLVSLCCRHQRDCLHRKVLAAIKQDKLPVYLQTENISPSDLWKAGKDMWNNTALHYIARWGWDPVFDVTGSL